MTLAIVIQIQQHLIEMIQSGKFLEKAERHDLFSNLLEAHGDEGVGGEMKLSTSELVGKTSRNKSCRPSASFSDISMFLGNVFIFLLAGHEVPSVPRPDIYCLTFLENRQQHIR